MEEELYWLQLLFCLDSISLFALFQKSVKSNIGDSVTSRKIDWIGILAHQSNQFQFMITLNAEIEW